MQKTVFIYISNPYSRKGLQVVADAKNSNVRMALDLVYRMLQSKYVLIRNITHAYDS